MKTLVLIPTYNERENIIPLVKAILDLPEPIDVPLEEPVWQYLQQFSSRLNDILFGNAEFFVVGYRP